ncbi:MAG: hypothetical protein ACSHW0_06325 [Thalassotalea sp.]
MNKHNKLALFIAPFLIVIGYIASDYYVESTQEYKVIPLTLTGACQLQQECLFTAGDLKLNIYQQQEQTIVNATHALDSVLLFVVKEEQGLEVSQPFQLTNRDSQFYWQADLGLQKYSDQPNKIRLIAELQGNRYISEFLAKY